MTAIAQAMAALQKQSIHQSETKRYDLVSGTTLGKVVVEGKRVSGKQWKMQKTASSRSHLPKARQTPYDLRQAAVLVHKEVKLKEVCRFTTMIKSNYQTEMKAGKIADMEARKKAIQDKRAKKEERERYELLQAKMHAKSVERLRKREKRNKLLKER